VHQFGIEKVKARRIEKSRYDLRALLRYISRLRRVLRCPPRYQSLPCEFHALFKRDGNHSLPVHETAPFSSHLRDEQPRADRNSVHEIQRLSRRDRKSMGDEKRKHRVACACAHARGWRNRIFTYRGASGRKDTPGTAVIAAPGGPGGSGSRTCLRPWPPPRRPPARRPHPRQHPAPAVDSTAVAAVAAVVAGDAGGGYCSADGRGPRQSATIRTCPLISRSLAR